MFKILITVFFVLFSASVTAANRPCMEIAEACKNAGFSQHGPAGKDILKDCVTPIVAGKPVPNVTFNDQSVIAACKIKMENLKK